MHASEFIVGFLSKVIFSIIVIFCSSDSFSEILKLRFDTIHFINIAKHKKNFTLAENVLNELKRSILTVGDYKSNSFFVVFERYNVKIIKNDSNKFINIFNENSKICSHEIDVKLTVKDYKGTILINHDLTISTNEFFASNLTFKDRKKLNIKLSKKLGKKIKEKIRKFISLNLGDFFDPN